MTPENKNEGRGGAAVEERPCCTVPTLHTRIHPWWPPADPTAAALERLAREPHKAYPICHARDYPPSMWWERTRISGPYPWCPNKARWGWGEQNVCDEHAAQLAFGIPVLGVFPDGRWCRRSAPPVSGEGS